MVVPEKQTSTGLGPSREAYTPALSCDGVCFMLEADLVSTFVPSVSSSYILILIVWILTCLVSNLTMKKIV